MRNNLDTDPRVLAMADALGIPELHVIGCLWKLWSWADQHTLDGNAIRVTDVTLDRFTCVTGFAVALRKVGWLEGRDNALTFPRFVEHNGQTAKKRGETAVRVEKHRNAKRVTDVTQNVLPEKRREEKSITHTHTATKPESNLSEAVQAEWHRWEKHLESRGINLSPIARDSNVMDLLRLPEEKQLEVIRFSIQRNAAGLIWSGKSNGNERHMKNQRQTIGQILENIK
jgi:hypothetical protein